MWRNEDELLKRAAGGDGEAFRTLMDRHYATLWRLASRLTENREDEEDVLQETLLRAWANLRRFRGDSTLETWLTRIVVNTALGVERARERRKTFLSLFRPAVDDRDPERLSLSSEVDRIIERTMRTFTPMEAAAYTLHDAEGWSAAQIGRELGVSPDAARQALYRAAKKVRAAVQPLVR